MNKTESTKTNKKSKNDIIKNIKENYEQIEKSIVNQLYMRNSLHSSTTGFAREDVWKQLFEMIIPKKFVIEQSVFIIDSSFRNDDSQDGISREVNLVIIDETYTPYIFRYGRIKFVPVEAVAVAIECKSGDDCTKDWCGRIDKLKTSDNSIARLATTIAMHGVQTQKSTRPIKILCSMNHASNTELFDICIVAHGDKANKVKANIKIEYNDNFKNLFDIYFDLNHYKYEPCDNETLENYKSNQKEKPKLDGIKISDYDVTSSSLLSFNFQLNQLLMLINNPLLFPHLDYVDMFNGIEQKDRKKR